MPVPTFESLTEPQRLVVRDALLPVCTHTVPTTRDTMLDHVRDCLDIKPPRWQSTARASWTSSLEDAIETVLRPAPATPDNDEEDDDSGDWNEPVKRTKKEIKSAKGGQPFQQRGATRAGGGPSSRKNERARRGERRPSEAAREFHKYLALDDSAFGERLGRFVVTAQAIGLLSPKTLSAIDRAVLWALSMFLDGRTGRGAVSQAAITFRAGCSRRAAQQSLQRAAEIGILKISGPARRKQTYHLLRPVKWPKRLHDEMRARLAEELLAVQEAQSLRGR